MKKAAIASLLAVSALMVSPGLLPRAGAAYAQGQIQLDPAEGADYQAATTANTPAALEGYLAKYPKSPVKIYVLKRIMVLYSQTDHAKAITAADNVLAVDPNDLQAYLFEVSFRQEAKDLDGASSYAQKGLAVTTKSEGVSADDFAKQQAYAKPYFYDAIGQAANAKKDSAAAISAFKSELALYPDAQQTTPAVLQVDYYLATAYYQSTPPDYINCTYYATRTAALAPDQYKAQFQPLATYCYKKYHGDATGYDNVVAVSKANLNPPADFAIKPAPTPEDQVTALLAGTSEADLPKLALSDKEYVLANGKQADGDKVFNTIKGKESQIPGALVIASTADQLQVAVSEDAVQSKTADFTFNMKEPLKTVPAVGAKVTLIGTYASYTQKPLMITMSDSSLATKEPAKKAPAKPAPRRR